MNELFPEIKQTDTERVRVAKPTHKAPFIFRDPLLLCHKCLSRGPFKLRSLSGEFERSCKCGFSFIIDGPEAEKIQKDSYQEQYLKWERSP